MSNRHIALQILGTGEYIPPNLVTSEHLDERLGKPSGWVFEHTGVATRAFSDVSDNTITMGTKAANNAIESAGIDSRELDAIISVGSVPYQAIPCTAAFLQRELDLAESGIPAFDINATCLGFLVALDLVSQAISTGRFRTVLIVASEPASVGLNWDDPLTAGLFGDGAAAIVLGRARRPESCLLASHMQTYSAGIEFCQIRAGGSGLSPRLNPEAAFAGSVFEMQGRQAYKFAAEYLPAFIANLLQRANIPREAVDFWIPHQASGRAVEHLRHTLGIPTERIALTLRSLGNQVSASLPIALHRTLAASQVQQGSTVALVGLGAGLALGGAILRL